MSADEPPAAPGPTPPPTPLDRLGELAARVDAFFARVAARHGADLRCAAGCDGCCRTRLTVTTVEADAVRGHVATLEAPARARLAEVAARPVDAAAPRCAALDDDGRCLVYAARPLVCRSHGVPIRLRGGDGLPVVQACELNFTARGPAAADADCVLDQQTLSATLLAIDQLHAAATATPAGARHDLGEVLRAACRAAQP
ncbi:MAG: YkgJ family cysteine cluster protein [Kofleriaceae bacterium]|nr:YkgJ family cysteine cluster protein [Kofleriaceae bacterium]